MSVTPIEDPYLRPARARRRRAADACETPSPLQLRATPRLRPLSRGCEPASPCCPRTRRRRCPRRPGLTGPPPRCWERVAADGVAQRQTAALLAERKRPVSQTHNWAWQRGSRGPVPISTPLPPSPTLKRSERAAVVTRGWAAVRFPALQRTGPASDACGDSPSLAGPSAAGLLWHEDGSTCDSPSGCGGSSGCAAAGSVSESGAICE